VTRRVRALGTAVDGSSDDRGWQDMLADRLRSRSRRLQQAIARAGALYAPERLHAVRIAAKKLRYALELTRDSGTAPVGVLVRTLKDAQEILGQLNDLQVLAAHVRAVAVESAGRSELARGLETLASLLEAECRRLHGRFVRREPRLLRVCEQCMEQVAPRVAARRPVMRITLARAPQRRAS
jgi:CHAD domain-containing protein